MASRTYRAEAIVLKTLDFGEADRILTLLTRHFGKVRVVAKGIRRPTSRLSGHAEPLAHATFQMARGRELDVLTGAESRAAYRTMRDDLGRIAAGWYIAELADRLTVDHAPSAPVFDLVETALRHLEAGHAPSLVCRWFDLRLLDRSGFRPELGRCVQCEGSLPEAENVWSPLAGGVICAGCPRAPEHAGVPLSVRALKSMRFLLSSDLLSAARLRVDDALALELERSLRGFLQAVIERDVQAARLIDEIRQLPNPGPGSTSSAPDPSRPAARSGEALPRLPASA